MCLPTDRIEFLPDYPYVLLNPTARMQRVAQLPELRSSAECPAAVVCPTVQMVLFAREPEESFLPDWSFRPKFPESRAWQLGPNQQSDPLFLSEELRCPSQLIFLL